MKFNWLIFYRIDVTVEIIMLSPACINSKLMIHCTVESPQEIAAEPLKLKAKSTDNFFDKLEEKILTSIIFELKVCMFTATCVPSAGH